MTNIKDIVAALRCCREHDNCDSKCPRFYYENCISKLIEDAADAINELQAAAPKRGEWLDSGSFDELYARAYVCSACGREALGFTNYCPNCGAKMEVSEDA